MRTSSSMHRRGLLAGLLLLTASVSGAVAIASGGTTPTPTAPAATAAAAGRDAGTLGDDGRGTVVVRRGGGDGGRGQGPGRDGGR
jgi:hypothetical protein